MKNERLIVIVILSVFVFLFEELYIRLILISAALIYILLDIYEKKYLSGVVNDDEAVIYCEWEGRINDSDFLANEESTISSLADIGFTLDKAVGNEYVFHTEDEAGNDLYFSGVIMRTENSGFIIRASNINDLQ